MITQIFNLNILKILTIFSISPGARFLRKELKEKTMLNNVTLDESLNILINTGIIRKEKRPLSFNLEHKEILEIIKKEHKKLNELYTNAYFPILELIEFLSPLKKTIVYLFGSHAKLIHHESSDVDIAIISDNISEQQKNKINKFASKLERKYNKKIEVHYFGNEFHKNKSDPLVKDILKNGRKLI